LNEVIRYREVKEVQCRGGNKKGGRKREKKKKNEQKARPEDRATATSWISYRLSKKIKKPMSSEDMKSISEEEHRRT
jgi:hypothetical protein